MDVPAGQEFDLLRGDWVPPEPLEVRWEMGRKSPSDVVWTTLAVPVIVNARVLEVLRDGGFSGWSTYPVVVHDKAGEVVEGYVGLVVTGRCGAMDNARSPKVDRKFPGGVFEVYKGLFFDEREWDGSDVFCPAGSSGWVFVVPRVAEALRAAKVRNVSLEPVADVERSSL
jgi:hypothetical protein